MPYIVHTEELQSAIQTAGWNQINLMNDEIATELDAGLELNVLAPNAPPHAIIIVDVSIMCLL